MSYCTKCNMLGGHSVSCENGQVKTIVSGSAEGWGEGWGGQCGCGRPLTSAVCPCQTDGQNLGDDYGVGYTCVFCRCYVPYSQTEAHICFSMPPQYSSSYPPVHDKQDIIIDVLKKILEKLSQIYMDMK